MKYYEKIKQETGYFSMCAPPKPSRRLISREGEIFLASSLPEQGKGMFGLKLNTFSADACLVNIHSHAQLFLPFLRPVGLGRVAAPLAFCGRSEFSELERNFRLDLHSPKAWRS
jgi:hypothetical protein